MLFQCLIFSVGWLITYFLYRFKKTWWRFDFFISYFLTKRIKNWPKKFLFVIFCYFSTMYRWAVSRAFLSTYTFYPFFRKVRNGLYFLERIGASTLSTLSYTLNEQLSMGMYTKRNSYNLFFISFLVLGYNFQWEMKNSEFILYFSF